MGCSGYTYLGSLNFDNQSLMGNLPQVMKVHVDRKAILEVEFTDEEGTGLGPTLEFYALVNGIFVKYWSLFHDIKRYFSSLMAKNTNFIEIILFKI